MNEKISTSVKNETWTLVKPLKEIKPIGVKRVYKVNRDHIGKIMKYKARLVVEGYSDRDMDWTMMKYFHLLQDLNQLEF